MGEQRGESATSPDEGQKASRAQLLESEVVWNTRGQWGNASAMSSRAAGGRRLTLLPGEDTLVPKQEGRQPVFLVTISG